MSLGRSTSDEPCHTDTAFEQTGGGGTGALIADVNVLSEARRVDAALTGADTAPARGGRPLMDEPLTGAFGAGVDAVFVPELSWRDASMPPDNPPRRC
jgi:hypothetical protein